MFLMKLSDRLKNIRIRIIIGLNCDYAFLTRIICKMKQWVSRCDVQTHKNHQTY